MSYTLSSENIGTCSRHNHRGKNKFSKIKLKSGELINVHRASNYIKKYIGQVGFS